MLRIDPGIIRSRRIELGHGPESVHLTSDNGPVTIKDDE
jgi:hypothetical protein